MTRRLIALGLAAALIALFPAHQLLLLGQQGDDLPSSVSIFYLRAMLQASPHDRDLRLGLARRLAQVGKVDDARAVLEPLGGAQDLASQRLLLELDWQRYIGLDRDDARRNDLGEALEARLRRVQSLPELPAETLEAMARHWLAMNRPDQAAALYERLAARQPEQRYEWLEQAAQWWLKAGDPERSAKAWHDAFEADGARPDASIARWFVRAAQAGEASRREAALSALKAARQSQGGSALIYARQFIEHYPRDPQFLDLGIAIALEHNDARQALAWSRRYLDVRPDDLQALERNANTALAAGQPEEAARTYEQLAERDPDNGYHWLSLAGEWWLKAGDPERSAKAWHDAFETADDAEDDEDADGDDKVDASPDLGLLGWLVSPAAAADRPPDGTRRRAAALSSLRAVRQSESGGAVDYAREYIEHYPHDPEILAEGIEITLARGDLEQALAWSDDYLKLRPEDAAAQERHVRIALALNRMDEALDVLTHLVETHPENTDYRHRLAQAQRWAGRPEEALASYTALARRESDDAWDAQVLELAQSLSDRQAMLAALQRMAKRHPLDARQRALLVDLHYELGDPERGIAQIQRWIADGGAQRPLWVRMATWQAQLGQLDTALASWQRYAERFGHDLEETRARARLQAQLWRLPEAVATLQALPERPAADDAAARDYWDLLGELAWRTADSATAGDAYHQLARTQPLDTERLTRLIRSSADSGNIEIAMQATRRDWREHQRPTVVLAMLDAAQRHQRGDLLQTLFAMTRDAREIFADSASYWSLYADQRLALRDLAGALRAYRRALALTPDDAGLRSALLYTLIEDRRDAELRRLLARWQADAAGSAALMPAVAAGYSALGEPRRALPWYQRAVRATPDDYLLILDYADALEQARRLDSAYRLRRHALLELRPRLREALRSDAQLSADAAGQQTRALSLQVTLQGPESAGTWLQALASHPRRSGDDAWLFDAYLARQQPVYARYWLLRARLHRQSMPYWQTLSLALARNDQAELQRLLASPEGRRLAPLERVEALRRLGDQDQALALALATRDASGKARRQAAELSAELPNVTGAQLTVQEVGNVDIIGQSLALQRSRGRLSTRLELGRRRLHDQGLYAEIDGLDEERFARLDVAWRQRRGRTRFTLGALDSEDDDLIRLGGEQRWQLTSRLGTMLFADYNAQVSETDLLRVLGVRDQLGATLDWSLTGRDSLTLGSAYTRFYSREERHRLADGYRLEGDLAHDLIRGATRQLQVHLLASSEHNTLEPELPADIAARVTDTVAMDDIVPDRYTFVGAGISLARGEPGSDAPQVASPRYRFELQSGYSLPDKQLGLRAAANVGSRVFGSDELSLQVGLERSGGSTRSDAYSALLSYRFFLGR